MSASCGAKTASIRKVVLELAERPDWNVDRQTDGRLFSFIYIDYRTISTYCSLQSNLVFLLVTFKSNILLNLITKYSRPLQIQPH